MHKFSEVLHYIWHLKNSILFLFIVLPLLLLVYSFNKPPTFMALQALSLQTEQAHSSLLKHVNEPNFARILNRQLQSDMLVTRSLQDVGILLEGNLKQGEKQLIESVQNSLRLTSAGKNVIEISVSYHDRRQILRLLEAVAINFTDTLMAPERFAKDELANSLGNQIQLLTQLRQETAEKIIRTQQQSRKAKAEKRKALERKLTALEFQAQTLNMQKNLAETQYREALELAQQSKFNPIIKPESEPIIISTDGGTGQHLWFVGIGALIASLLSFTLVFLRALSDTSFKKDREVRQELGLRILGHMPNLGDVQFDEGRILTMPKLNL